MTQAAEGAMTTTAARFLKILLVTMAFVGNAQATFHLWRITQVYSNADGSVQYAQLVATAANEQFINGHTIKASQGATTHSYTFTRNLPGNTSDSMSDGYYGIRTSYR